MSKAGIDFYIGPLDFALIKAESIEKAYVKAGLIDPVVARLKVRYEHARAELYSEDDRK